MEEKTKQLVADLKEFKKEWKEKHGTKKDRKVLHYNKMVEAAYEKFADRFFSLKKKEMDEVLKLVLKKD